MVPDQRNKRGFSLIELLTVIAVMGILTGIVLTSLEPRNHDQLQSTAQTIAVDIDYARNLAITNNSKYRITFHQQNNRYVLTHTGSNSALNTLPASPFYTNASSATKQKVDLNNLPQMGLPPQIVAVQTAGTPPIPKSYIEFGPLGEMTQPENIEIWLASGVGQSRRYLPVQVNAITGLVTIGDFNEAGPPRTNPAP